ncbi:hypothetical protein FGG08_006514 [Glutinoglossum americanum]|uniref:EamA domain-containing protein n=1 Tax=Glutinoglossum americanum TaxID=1670608 RepID=A0A9P8I3C2_9PEZI|nr:hypothetical protein FGG08_006514 [Glutinoglossum americanum]
MISCELGGPTIPGEEDSRTPEASPNGSPRNCHPPNMKLGYAGLARRTLGIFLLLVTVFLWTASNFLASFIFANNTYSKPYFVTYVNTAFFAVALIPIAIKRVYKSGFSVPVWAAAFWWKSASEYSQVPAEENCQYPKPDAEEDTPETGGSPANHLPCEDEISRSKNYSRHSEMPNEDALTTREIVKLSLEFCILWFVANYFTAACLKYTTVASATVLSSTSSMWTLLLGALVKVERFSVKKLLGVLASLVGIVLISTFDINGNNDDNRGSFPHKSHRQLAIGDAMAFFSAIMYGIYTLLMKKRIENEARVNMPFFFGLVGLFNVLFLWPGFFILHYTGEETFQLPPTSQVWIIVLLNSTTSLVSDFCWAYAMLLTSPLVVTVGISLTIPLSLIGQMVLNRQFSGGAYWVGAGIVFLSFIFINHESKDDNATTRKSDINAFENAEGMAE